MTLYWIQKLCRGVTLWDCSGLGIVGRGGGDRTSRSCKSKVEPRVCHFAQVQQHNPIDDMNSSAMKESVSPLSGKKKFEVFIEDSLEAENKPKTNTENKMEGHTFVGYTGPLDCSIGNIFQDDFSNPGSFTIDSSSQHQRSKALSVLIVDDSVIHRKITMKALGGLIDEVMWKCDSAENGESAMQLVQNSVKIPDVIIIDQNMESTGGRMLGHQVVELLRADRAFDSVVIIGCTGMSEIAHQDLQRAGCDTVWSKPMPSRDEAQAQIWSFLQKKRINTVEEHIRYNISQSALNGRTAGQNISPLSYVHSRTGDSTVPAFKQVKIARVAYKPIPWEMVVDRSYNRQRAMLSDHMLGNSELISIQNRLDRLTVLVKGGGGGVIPPPGSSPTDSMESTEEGPGGIELHE